jgi:SAM-dependent MidA family methyltransferase
MQRQGRMAAAGLDWPRGYRGEWCPWLAPWIESVYASMDWGALLLIDYGFARHELDHPGRSSGSLCAHVQHRRLDAPQELISAPGTRDLTAHVDFSALAGCAAQAGFSVDGFATQSRFLMNLGVLNHAQALMSQANNVMEQTRLAQSLQMLLLESEMGEVFKVMLLTKNLSSEKIAELTSFGFESGDRRAGL